MIKRRSHELLLSKTFLQSINSKFDYQYSGLYNIDSDSEDYSKSYDSKFALIMDKYEKQKYRTILYEIELNKNLYSEMNLSNEFIFIHIEIKCIINIIEKKYRDYKEKAYLKGVDKWLKIFDKFLEHFSNGIENLNFNKKEQYEYLNYYHLIKLYLYAVLEKQKKII